MVCNNNTTTAIAMAITIVMYIVVTKHVKKPTNLKIVDDAILGINATQGVMYSMVALVGAITLSSLYICDKYVS